MRTSHSRITTRELRFEFWLVAKTVLFSYRQTTASIGPENLDELSIPQFFPVRIAHPTFTPTDR